MVWFLFLYSWNLFVKNKLIWVVLITSFYYTTEPKNLLVIFAGFKKFTSYFCWFWKLLSEKLRDLQDAMPCHLSLCILVPQVLWIWESSFYSWEFFNLHSFLLFSSLPWGLLLNLKVNRASCWSPKHSPSPSICLNHNNPQKKYGGRFYLWFTAGWLHEESAPPYGLSVWSQSHTVRDKLKL